jgi:hypothetical protein
MDRSKLARLATLASQAANVLIFNGNPDESISARAWRRQDKNPRWAAARRIIDRIFFWELGHCHRAYLLDVEHATQYLEALNDR